MPEPEEIDETDSDIQIEDTLFIRKLRFIPLQSCPRAPTQMIIGQHTLFTCLF